MPDHPPPADPRLADAFDCLPDAQRQRVAGLVEAMRTHPAAPSMRLELQDGVLQIGMVSDSLELATLLQMVDMGTIDADFHKGLIGQIACLGAHKRRVDDENSNFVMSVIRSIKPRDELEAILATQMGAIHAATMMLARRLNHVETIPQQDAA